MINDALIRLVLKTSSCVIRALVLSVYVFGISFLWPVLLYMSAVTGKLWPKLYEIKLQPVRKHVDRGVIKKLCVP